MKINVCFVEISPLLRLRTVLILLFISSGYAAVAQQTIRGKVTDNQGESIVGASVVIKGTTKGTTSNSDGVFVLDNLDNGTYTLSISYIGFITQAVKANVPGSNNLKIRLETSAANLEEVIVTGVFDKRKRIDASVAISTISADQIRAQVPVSAADLLKNIPGVFVNSSAGEIRNQVIVRGTPTKNDIGTGYYYVSMQEDGLPVTNLTGSNFGPDYFLRADATISRVEAVRGGSASITGSDAPGGLFNYVSKTGGKNFAGDVILRTGLEGNANPYNRADVNIGGPLNKKGDLTYNVGGFYRYSDGARYAGYALNNGGQVRGNIVKKYAQGSLKVYGKYLNDRNGYFDFLPYTNYDKPTIAPGFDNTNTLAGPGNVVFDYRFTKDGSVKNFNPKNLIHNTDKVLGIEWQHDFGKGWSINNNIKYSSKSSAFNTQMPLGITSASGLSFMAFLGLLGTPGDLSVTDLTTGQQVVAIKQEAGYKVTDLVDKLPNNQIQAAPVVLSIGNGLESRVNELMEQLSINKSIGKTNLTLGAYYGRSAIVFEQGFAGQSYTTLENRPHMLGITYTLANGDVQKLTNPQGLINTGINYSENNLKNNRLDLFFGQSTALTDKLTLDYGFRYNYSQFVGSARGQVADAVATAAGGYDRNPLTLYDNTVYNYSSPWTYNKQFNSLSFSGALNYKFNENQAIYGRYSIGRKAPDLAQITSPTTQTQADLLNLEPIHMTQAEIGFKSQLHNLALYITPFYSEVSNMANTVFANDVTPNTFYYTPAVYSTQRTVGIEVEGNLSLGPNLSIRANATYQEPKSVVARTWNIGDPGRQDDKVVEITDAAVPLTPKVLALISPTYKLNKFSTSLFWRYVGSSYANTNRAFSMAAYDQVDLRIGYQLTKRIDLNFNINNVFNKLGVTGWYAPGGFPASIFTDNFTQAQREANPNSIWGARTTQPRSFFLTLNYRL